MGLFGNKSADKLVDARRDLEKGRITERDFSALASKTPIDVIGEAMALYGQDEWGQ